MTSIGRHADALEQEAGIRDGDDVLVPQRHGGQAGQHGRVPLRGDDADGVVVLRLCRHSRKGTFKAALLSGAAACTCAVVARANTDRCTVWVGQRELGRHVLPAKPDPV